MFAEMGCHGAFTLHITLPRRVACTASRFVDTTFSILRYQTVYSLQHGRMVTCRLALSWITAHGEMLYGIAQLSGISGRLPEGNEQPNVVLYPCLCCSPAGITSKISALGLVVARKGTGNRVYKDARFGLDSILSQVSVRVHATQDSGLGE
ncbi:hypothetical protein VTK56DRAFT_9257 [Thermocarpiscus australiensis]